MVEDNKSIFVSYRRDETAAYAGWLADKLGDHFGEQSVFRDIASIEPGMDFVEAMERALASCAVMLVVIGRNWANALKEHERTRQKDYMRLEVATALKRNDVRVIPVLVQGALIPRAEELPNDLSALRRRQAIELHDTNWESDIESLIAVVDKAIGGSAEGIRRQSTIRVRRRKWDWQHKYPLHVSLAGKDFADLYPGQEVARVSDPGACNIEARADKKLTASTEEDFQRITGDLEQAEELIGDLYNSEVSVYLDSDQVIDLLCGYTWDGEVFIQVE